MRLLVAALCAVHATPPTDRTLPGKQLRAAAETQRLRQLSTESSEQRAAMAMAAASSLLSRYQKEEDGLFGDTLPWIEANAIETLCDWAIRSGGLRALPPRAFLTRCSRTSFTSAPAVSLVAAGHRDAGQHHGDARAWRQQHR